MSSIDPELKFFAQRCLQLQVSFCLYREPGEDKVKLAVADTKEEIPLQQVFHQSNPGFVIAPFRPDFKVIYLPQVRDWNKQTLDNLSVLAEAAAKKAPVAAPKFSSTSRRKYFETINLYLKAIRAGAMQKAILSRLKVLERPADFEPVPYFEELGRTYPQTFCYLLYTPQYGMWCGATPEILLQAKEGALHTVALAGTLPLNSRDSWSEKEIKEQALVSEHIRKSIQHAGISRFSESEPNEIAAGRVRHLKTDFKLSPTDSTDSSALLQYLHPTPAVGGLPQEAAVDFILKNEPHQRDLYTGFLGPVDSPNSFGIYVNLRCMRITSQQLVLYLGGGITAGSDPEKEWRETQNKARTLLDVIERQQKS